MSFMIKLIATDMDGTLLTDEGKFAPDFFDVLRQLNEKDIKFVAASGRSCYSLKKVFSPHDREIFYISDNGGYINYGNNSEVIHPMTSSQVFSTVEACLGIDKLQIILCAKDRAYFLNPDREHLSSINYYYTDYEIINDYKNLNEQILKVALYDPFGSSENAYPKIKDKLDKSLRAVVSSVNWIDIMNKDLNKGTALKRMQNILDITQDETMAFGDFNNDIEMLKCAKYSFAMQNATEQVKEYANYIADTNNNFGVVKAIKQFVLDK